MAIPIIGALLGSLFTDPVLSTLAGTVLDKGADLIGKYLNKEITREQAQAELGKVLAQSIADVERAHAETLAKTFANFMDAATKSPLLAAVWAAVMLSQLAVLVWHQAGIPAIIALGIVTEYPSSGSTVEWAYALIAAGLGLGPMVLRAGPGSSTIADRLKSLIGR